MKCNITFTDATLEEAEEIFRRLGMEPGDVEVKEAPKEEQSESEEKPKTKAKPKPKAKAKPKTKPKTTKKAKKEEPEEPEEDEPEEPEEEAEEEDEEEDGGDGDTDIASMTRLRDVLMHLIEEGREDEDSLVEECLRIQKKVPVLKKINNLEDRVRRAAAVLL